MATSPASAGTRTGTVAAYTTGSDVALVRQARALVGRVTLSGRSGLRAINTLKRDGDLWGVDLDPACYLDRGTEPEGLFPFDWVSVQRELNLPVIRNAGTYVRRGDKTLLGEAFSGKVIDGTVRTVSLDGGWLQSKHLPTVLSAVRNCDDRLGFVLAASFDPLDPLGAVDCLLALAEACNPCAAQKLRSRSLRRTRRG